MGFKAKTVSADQILTGGKAEGPVKQKPNHPLTLTWTLKQLKGLTQQI